MIIKFAAIDPFSVLHSVEDADIKYEKDGDSISAVDFFSVEAAYCKLTLYADDWMKSNLLDISTDDLIQDTNVLKMQIQILRGAETYIFYLTKDKISYTMKTNEIDIVAINLVGVMLELGKTTKDFSCILTDFEEYLENTVNDIFTDSGITQTLEMDIETNYSQITNFQLTFNHGDEFTGAPINQVGYYGQILDSTIRWRYIGQPEGEEYPLLIMIDWHSGNYDPVDDYVVYGYTKLKIRIVDEVILEQISYYNRDMEGADPGLCIDRFNNLQTEINNQIGVGWGSFPGTSQTSFIGQFPTVYNFDDNSNFFFSGFYYFDLVELQKDTDSNFQNTDQNEILKALLVMNNLYIYSNQNTLYIGNKSFSTYNPTEIETCIEYKETPFFIEEADLEYITSVFKNATNTKNILTQYYNTFRETITKKIIAKIIDQNLELFDCIKINNKTVTIVSIKPDNDNIISEIEAWG